MGREIKTLEGVNAKEILSAFNTSFSDYFIPFELTIEQLSSKMLLDKTDLSLSVGVFDNDELIAFILHGFDVLNNTKVVYNGGTGVMPQKRGSGLTQQMYHFILPLLKERGIDRLLLEVITENTQAIKSYQRSGFITKRELLCYKGEIVVTKTNDMVEIKEMKNYNWELMKSFWDIQPTWQNSKSVVNELEHKNVSLGAYVENQFVGYLVSNPTNMRIQQIAVCKGFRQKGIASTLLSELTKVCGNTVSIINVDRTSKGTNQFLRKVGLECNLEQLEMELLLDEK